jgi:hypothetical protein
MLSALKSLDKVIAEADVNILSHGLTEDQMKLK